MTTQERNSLKHKILKGLELNYAKLIAEKRANNQEIVVMHNGKIVSLKP